MTDDESAPLEKLAAAIQTFVNETSELPGMVHSALVVWEQARYDEDGDLGRLVDYTLPMDGSSLTGSLGLAAAADAMLRRDIIDD